MNLQLKTWSWSKNSILFFMNEKMIFHFVIINSRNIIN